MCDIHHHLQSCVWKAGFVVVVLCAMCLLSHVQASAALTRLQSQDAERLWMRIHKFTGAFLARQGQEFLSFFPSPLVPVSASSVIQSIAFSACLLEADRYIGRTIYQLLLPYNIYWCLYKPMKVNRKYEVLELIWKQQLLFQQ